MLSYVCVRACARCIVICADVLVYMQGVGYICRLCRIMYRVSRCIAYTRCVDAYAMRLGVLPGFKVYLNVSVSETNSNILRHAYQRVQVAT